MIGHLEELRDEGIFEFNSMPYLTYTVQALLNLQAFPKSERIRALARDLLDRMNLQYALGSLDFRRCVAFRRNTSFMDNPKRIPILSRDPHTQTMRVWAGAPAETLSDSHIALVAEIIPYTLPPVVAQWTLAKPREYYVRIGRGRLASPEIYSGGPGWLLTAGGVKRGAKSMIVARPTVLLLPDGERDYTRCFRIEGRGDYTQWNNTGVSRRFACGNSPVAGPEEALPAAESRNWAVFDPPKPERLLFALYSDKDLGFIAVFPDTDETAKALLEKLKQANPDETRLRHEFAWPSGGVIGYDVEAPAGTWTIKSVPEGIPVERKYDKWPQWDGDVPADAFARN
jgi:hypothetical protein